MFCCFFQILRYDEEEPAEEEEGGDIGKLTITEESGEHDENEGPSLTDTMVGMASMEAAGEEVAAEEEEEEKEEEDVDDNFNLSLSLKI